MSRRCLKSGCHHPLGGFAKINPIIIAASFMAVGADLVQGATVPVPNNSFESPATTFVSVNIDSWQKTPKPDWYQENPLDPGTYWTSKTGIFKNTATNSPDHIDNCDGAQALWLFAYPEVGLFQDYNSVDWNDPVPAHDFDAIFEIGKSFQLTVGLLVGGIQGGGGIQPGATLDLVLYYRDANSNRVTVASTTITNTFTVFNNSTNFLDFSVNVPTVQSGDPWAGQNIGILFLSTLSSNLAGGYWDLDNVRLTSTTEPKLSNAAMASGQFQFTLQSEPGLAFDILATTNVSLPASNWAYLATLTNVSGTVPFVDTNANLNQRFYRARQVP